MNFDATAFSWKCNAKVLTKTLKYAVDITAFSGNKVGLHYVIHSDGSVVKIIGISSDTFCLFNLVTDEVSGSGAFSFDPTLLMGLLKKRDGISLEYNKKLTISVTGSNYKATMDTVSAVDPILAKHIEARLVVKKGESSVPASLMEELRVAANLATLKNFVTSNPIVLGVRVKDGLMEVSSFDNFHSVYYKSKVSERLNFSIVMRPELFKIVDKFVSDYKEEAKFIMDDRRFLAIAPTYIISVPPIQIEDGIFDLVPGYIASSMKNPVAEVVFSTAVVDTVKNMLTIIDKDSKLNLKIVKKGIKLSVTSSSGSVTDAFQCKTGLKHEDLDFLIDPHIFDDLFSKIKINATVRFYKTQSSNTSSSFCIYDGSGGFELYMMGTAYES